MVTYVNRLLIFLSTRFIDVKIFFFTDSLIFFSWSPERTRDANL